MLFNFKKFIEKLYENVKEAPVKPEIKPDVKPSINPIRPPKPSISPEPKNYVELLKNIVRRYNLLTKEAPVKPEIKPDVKPSINPIRPPKPSVSPEPKNFIQKFENYEFDKNDNSDKSVNMNDLYKNYMGIEREESTLNKEDLYKLAKDIIKDEFFKESKIINFDDIIWDLELVPMHKAMTHIKKSGFKHSNEPIKKEFDDEVKKRDVINTITQGTAKKAQEYLYKFSDTHDVSKYNVPQKLIPMYFNFMKNALNTHHMVDLEAMENSPASGISFIKWDGETPIVVAKGTNLIILLHEMIKGINELFSYHGLPKDKETLDYVNKKTSTWHHESEGLKWGHILVEKFDLFFDEVENMLIQENVITSKSNEMKIILLSNFYSLDAKLFITYCDAIFKSIVDKPYDYFKNVYKSYINVEEIDNNEINNDVDYSKMSKDQLNVELNKMIDINDIEKIKLISKYLK